VVLPRCAAGAGRHIGCDPSDGALKSLSSESLVPISALFGEPEADGLPDHTPREREVQAHIAAGRTYGEIARELVISEKTVSVHVSHLLHKTGATNRVELAQLARRLRA
jgi:DNA-binding CsgD family transcriptional regulator